MTITHDALTPVQLANRSTNTTPRDQLHRDQWYKAPDTNKPLKGVRLTRDFRCTTCGAHMPRASIGASDNNYLRYCAACVLGPA